MASKQRKSAMIPVAGWEIKPLVPGATQEHSMDRPSVLRVQVEPRPEFGCRAAALPLESEGLELWTTSTLPSTITMKFKRSTRITRSGELVGTKSTTGSSRGSHRLNRNYRSQFIDRL